MPPRSRCATWERNLDGSKNEILLVAAFVLFAGWIPLALTGAGQLRSQDWGALGWLDWVCFGYALLGPLVPCQVGRLS